MRNSKIITTEKFVAPSVPEHNSRRDFMKQTGAILGAAGIMSMVPMGTRAAAWAAGSDAPELKEVKVGFIPLTDCASLVIASVMKFDEKYGIKIVLSKEASWAGVRDKLANGELHAAHVLYGLVYGVHLGIGGQKKDMSVLMTLNNNGQAITLSNQLKDKGVTNGAALKRLVDAEKRDYTFAQTFPTGTHAMWLYYWLASYGINPLKDVKTITVPPPQMVANMRIGNMDGFCVGEPWNNRAIYDKIGFTAATTQDIWKDHPEKVLGCTAEFSQKYPNTARRVVILRRPVKQDLALTRRIKKQMELLLTDEAIQAYEYAVLVTNTAYNLHAIAQLYRDRADCENGFDELKNQWGWGGFTTQDIERCQTSARSVALIYNWWSWYCRAAKPDARMEAITSRPLLLAGVGRAVKHAGQTTLYLTAMHAASEHLNTLIANIHAALAHVKTLAEQLPKIDPWHVLLAHIISKITHRPPPIYARIFTLATG